MPISVARLHNLRFKRPSARRRGATRSAYRQILRSEERRSQRSNRLLETQVRALVRATLAHERRRPGEISVLLGDDSLLRELNRRYRSLDRTTDVLTFGYGSGAAGAPRAAASPRRGKRHAAARVDGDLVISLDRVAVQARRYRVRPGRELARLVVHGTLHLAGLDHHEAAARRSMRRAEARALRASAQEVAALEHALDLALDLAVDPKGRNRTH